MKKTLLAVAAALAASVISSQAQVYSQNIVGYVNSVCTNGYNFLSTPLDATDGNGNFDNVTNILANPFNGTIGNGPLDGSTLYVWNAAGTAFNLYYFDANPADAAAQSQTFTGITDSNGNFINGPALTNGVGYYFAYSAVSGFGLTAFTNTIVGSVRGVNGNITNTVVIPATPVHTLIGSGLPIGGGVLTGLQFTNVNVFNPGAGQGPLDGDEIQVPFYNSSGVLVGYTSYYFDSNPADAAAQSQTFTGITDPNGNFVPEPQIPVGKGFLFINNNGGAVNWTQVLNLQ